MFNDLNNQGQSGQPAVDDIFAETDKVSPPSAAGIETRRVGLAAGDNLPSPEITPKRSVLKIIVFVTIGLAILGGAYLAYSQFSKIKAENEEIAVPLVPSQPVASSTAKKPGTPANYVSPSDIPGLENSAFSSASTSEVILATTTDLFTEDSLPPIDSPASSTAESISRVDSDQDGLTDTEEKDLGTNINIIDTDMDGLSDYEEVNIYKSNPLSADTDGDTYLDGAEVKNGYDPTRAGAKLSGN